VGVLKEAQAAARTIGFDIFPLEARPSDDLEGVIARAIEQHSDGVLISTIEGFFFASRSQIIDAMINIGSLRCLRRHRLDLLRQAHSWLMGQVVPTCFGAPPAMSPGS